MLVIELRKSRAHINEVSRFHFVHGDRFLLLRALELLDGVGWGMLFHGFATDGSGRR